MILALPAFAACGEERTFTAQQFVEEVRAEGVELRLGERLFSDDPGRQVYALQLPQTATPPGTEREPIGGSISVHEDTDGADERLGSCKRSADLLCYQAANIVVVLEGGGVEAQQLALAVERLSEEE